MHFDVGSNRGIAFYCQRRRWRHLPAPALGELILHYRRRAVFEHLSDADWHEVDLMRRRLARLESAR